ncbi:hypothetical protein C6H68_15910 [Photorhabdus luminescens]|nr:hypothetical protein C6H68_15910 [Photorhabdus luminescens]
MFIFFVSLKCILPILHVVLTAYLNRAILFAILNLGSAQNPHVLRVRSGFSALSVFKLPATITPIEIGSYSYIVFL